MWWREAGRSPRNGLGTAAKSSDIFAPRYINHPSSLHAYIYVSRNVLHRDAFIFPLQTSFSFFSRTRSGRRRRGRRRRRRRRTGRVARQYMDLEDVSKILFFFYLTSIKTMQFFYSLLNFNFWRNLNFFFSFFFL